jgi:hypothetical protein
MTPEQAIEALGGKAMKISYQCSNCGVHEQTSAVVGVPEGMFYLGYRAHGDVLYCPNCVKTWKERNGMEYDEQYKDAQHLFAVWWNRKMQITARNDADKGVKIMDKMLTIVKQYVPAAQLRGV